MDRAEIQALCGLAEEELRRTAKVKFHLEGNNAGVLSHFAKAIAGEIRTGNQSGRPVRLILPIGPTAQYEELVQICNREKLSWTEVYVFGMDEFLDWQGRPIPLSHPLSFENCMRTRVFAKLDPALNASDKRLFFPHPFRVDEISETIERVGGIDCCFGGIGYHGHIAFNEPPLSRWHSISLDEMRNSLTRVVSLGDDSIVVQSINSAGGNSAAIPPMAVTLGMKDILAARKIRLYCAGGERHRAVFRITVAGTPTVSFPSTLVQGHPDVEIITDKNTAAPIQLGL